MLDLPASQQCTEEEQPAPSEKVAGLINQIENMPLRLVPGKTTSDQDTSNINYTPTAAQIEKLRWLMEMTHNLKNYPIGNASIDSLNAPRDLVNTNLFNNQIKYISIQNAEFKNKDDLLKLDEIYRKHHILTIRAQNTGDMYHIRLAMIMEPKYDLLILGVDDRTKKQAQQIVEMISDLENRRIYYTDEPRANNLSIGSTETLTTRMITRHQKISLTMRNNFHKKVMGISDQKLQEFKKYVENHKKLLAAIKIQEPDINIIFKKLEKKWIYACLADKFGSYTSEEGIAFQEDLNKKGFFSKNDHCKYVIVNFRATGHNVSDTLGSNAPALDTGLQGMQQIIEAVNSSLGEDVTVIPMGEIFLQEGQPNLSRYWEWPSASNRRLQISLLHYLNRNYNILGAIGMRSGIIDQIAFLGIKTISIDISPHRTQGNLPNIGPSKGWSRGLKLEAVYPNYGRVFMRNPRDEDLKRKIPNWQGKIHPEDLESIKSAISFYFGQDSDDVDETLQHTTHPLQKSEILAGLRRCPSDLSTMPKEDLVKRIHPYINELSTFCHAEKFKRDPEIIEIVKQYKDRVEQAIKAMTEGPCSPLGRESQL